MSRPSSWSISSAGTSPVATRRAYRPTMTIASRGPAPSSAMLAGLDGTRKEQQGANHAAGGDQSKGQRLVAEDLPLRRRPHQRARAVERKSEGVRRGNGHKPPGQ